jgi:murein DD-endopeptidase MepM/ murein hydrolase activator NlpD
MKRFLKRAAIVLLGLIALGLLVPQSMVVPVAGATEHSWSPRSFWHYPWGESVTHKGIDIFAPKGKPVLSATHGLCVFAGEIGRGGTSAVVLGPKWRLHYYAHLRDLDVSTMGPVAAGERIGTVGDSGNARGKQPHLHYGILTLVPYPWRIDGSKQGWKKMFYLNPDDYI